ncbi:GxxExxY protein [Alkalicella caledoniensis]|uniref:GxxExxY protein n=1 Tax=Alkalicella caledoniensis TaxID=2731377 RepID=A0A7G9W431_ALKCA|nr:GxxExxY protein [Alkalicella caledoniensis]QNO13443.1 GxxExxY protein [Alkalicella caledoniensis]
MIFYEELSDQIYECVAEIYKILGYGFPEKIYEKALISELTKRNIQVEAQKQLEVYYKDELLGTYFADLVVENKIIIELKTTKYIIDENYSQLLSYLKATGFKLGLLINFGPRKFMFRRLAN